MNFTPSSLARLLMIYPSSTVAITLLFTGLFNIALLIIKTFKK